MGNGNFAILENMPVRETKVATHARSILVQRFDGDPLLKPWIDCTLW